MNAPGSLLGALEKLVLERLPDQRFALCEEPPEWFHRLGFAAARGGDPLPIELLMPFLEAFLPDAERAWSGGKTPRVDSDVWTETAPDGEELHFEATALRYAGRPLLIVTRNDALFLERRRLLQRARELRLAHETLARELERKDVLIHCIVHDLASPLNSMLGALSLLEEGELQGRSAEMVHVATKAAMRQRELIHEILEVFAFERSALDAPYDELTVTPDVWTSIDAVIDALMPVALSRSVRLERPHRHSTASCRVIGEQRRLARVLSNLLENALRYTPPGKSVRVLVDEEAGGVRLAVEDEGPGVSPALLPRLFQKLGRGPEPGAGTGLGLYFCRITLENWGGAIGYEPRPMGGSRFWLQLRRAGAAPHPMSAPRERGGGYDGGEAPGRR